MIGRRRVLRQLNGGTRAQGAILIHVAGNAAEIDQVNQGDAALLTDFVRDKLAQIAEPTRGDHILPVPSTSAEDAVSRLERLASLKDRGVLTDEEFQQQKSKILDGEA